jgi:cytochrome P450
VFGPDVSTAVDVVARAVPLLNEFAAGRALSFVRPPLWLPTPANRRAREAQRRLRGYVTDLLRERKTAGGGGDDLIDRARMATDPETGERLNDTAVRDEVLIFLLAGHETTGSALALTLHALGRHPEVQRRIRTETFQVLGGDHPTAEQVPQLRYTSAAVSEALRLYPPGHALVRRAMEPDVLAGAPVPRGRVLAVSTYAIHHNPTVWPNPEVFEPERFLGPGEARHRYAHLPFGGGPRSCIAARLAFTELVVAVAAVVRAYVIDSLAPQPPIRARITLEPAGPLPARLTPVAAELGRPPAPGSAT